MLLKWSLSANLTVAECDNDSIGGQIIIIRWHERTLENGDVTHSYFELATI